MTCSMTGFARAQARGQFGTLTWELRSVNHRYLDVNLRLPDELRSLEPDCREHIVKFVRRGKCDAQLRFESVANAQARLEVDEARARAVAEAAERISGLLHPAAAVGALDLLRWPGVVQETPADAGALAPEVLRLLDRALQVLDEMRGREGRRIDDMLRERATRISTIVAEIRAQGAGIHAQLRSKLLGRFEELQLNVDSQRLEQELVLQLQRLDVSEELDRLDSHVHELRAALAGGGTVGRKLDFLMQEFNREANTLGSKCQDTAVTQRVIELKVLIEQMREQIQNVE
ncbi:MAG: YicC family protein [Gammaproteobacteria bacterium]|nr:YicC family protein [Gammaproteobacteria bacterium]